MKKAQAVKFWKALDESSQGEGVIKQLANKTGYGSKRTLGRLAGAARAFREGRSIEEIRISGWGQQLILKIRTWWLEEFPLHGNDTESHRPAPPSGEGGNQSGTPEPNNNVLPERTQDSSSAALDLSGLELDLQGTMDGRGLPSLQEDTRYWVIRVRLQNVSDKPITLGDFALHVTRDLPDDVEVHTWPHIGRDTYGSRAGVPLAEKALGTLISFPLDRPVVEGALRFQDAIPFGGPVRLTLSVKGMGQHKGMKRCWDLGRFSNPVGPGGTGIP